MKALILAAGQGTRLRRLTAHRPKPMLPLSGRPLLAHLVTWLRRHGVVQIAVNMHHCFQTITDYFGDGSGHGVSVRYSYERQLLGTAGAAKQLQRFFDETFVVLYGDVLTNLDLTRLARFHRAQRAAYGSVYALTAALYQVPNPTECGLVELDTTGRIRRFVEKPPPDQVFTDLAFSGIVICEPPVLNHIPADTFYDFGQDLIPKLLEHGVPMAGHAILEHEFVIDIGTLPGYLRALRQFATQPRSQTKDPISGHMDLTL